MAAINITMRQTPKVDVRGLVILTSKWGNRYSNAKFHFIGSVKKGFRYTIGCNLLITYNCLLTLCFTASPSVAGELVEHLTMANGINSYVLFVGYG